MNRCSFLGLLLPLLGAMLTWPVGAAEDAKLDPDLPYQAKKSNPITYDVEYRVIVTPPYHTKTLKVWLPLPQTDAGQEVEEGNLSTFPMTVKPRIGKETQFGNQFAYFEFDHPEGAQSIRHTFKIKVWELRWNVDADKVGAVKKWPAAFDKYLRSEQPVTLSDPLRKLVGEIVPERQGESRDLAAVMQWVNDNIQYDHNSASLMASSEHALKNKRGHCSDYHGLCSAFGRALGYPTRMTYGINTFPKNSPSHCKMEAFLPSHGWVSFDVSETQRLIAEIKKDGTLDEKKKDELIRRASERLQHGFRDNTWFVQTRGSDYDLAPPATKKVPVVRTIYAEADGVALPEPDPANTEKREFAWMTQHRYTPDKPISYAFKGTKSLQDK
ncbi:MAG: transglutaminase domain-containing protein [Gemmataceae bacterium]|nr:transglutaminase domain-containing protein [Gemmataceae bacterium]